jgi:hypothetical protein
MVHEDVRSGRGPTYCIPLLRRGAWEQSLDTTDVADAGGYRISLAPRLMIQSDAKRPAANPTGAEPDDGSLDDQSRRRLLAEAVELFANGTVRLGPLGEQSADNFRDTMRDIAGLPAAITNRWCTMLRERVELLAHPEWRGRRTLVVLPSNTFTCLEAVCEAVLGSTEVWIRPSRREPMSALRFVAALIQVGWPVSRLAFYPSGTEALEALMEGTDRQIVFGGDEISARLARAGETAALTLNGAGRGCALVAAGTDPSAAAQWLTPLVASDCGRFCKNVCTILCEEDPEPFAHALAEHLDAISLLTVDKRYPQASVASSRAEAYARMVMQRMRVGDQIVTSREILHQRNDRAAFLAPALVQIQDAGTSATPHPLLALEVPFPFASICRVTAGMAQTITSQSRFVYTMADFVEPTGRGLA